MIIHIRLLYYIIICLFNYTYSTFATNKVLFIYPNEYPKRCFCLDLLIWLHLLRFYFKDDNLTMAIYIPLVKSFPLL